jgi:hypothetical protein
MFEIIAGWHGVAQFVFLAGMFLIGGIVLENCVTKLAVAIHAKRRSSYREQVLAESMDDLRN